MNKNNYNIKDLHTHQELEWKCVKFSDSFSCEYKILGSKTLVISGIGYSEYDDEVKSIDYGSKIVDKYFTPNSKYILIQDWKNYINSSGRARHEFIKYVVGNNNLLAVIFCNTTIKQELSVILAHKLGILSKELRVYRTYREALSFALEFEKTGALPLIRNSVFKTIYNSIKFRNNKMYSGPVSDLLEYLNSIDWTSADSKSSDFTVEFSHPLLPIFDTLTTIKSQLDKITNERNRYLEELLNHKKQLEIELENRTTKIREGEEFFSKIIQNSPIGNFILDKDLNVTYINKKAEDYSYRIVDDLEDGKKHPLIIDIEKSCEFILKDKINLLLSESSQSDNIGPFETILYLSDGEKRTTEITFTTIQTGVLLSVVDITAKKEVENRLYIESVTDHLTKFYNRRYFHEILTKEFIRAKENNYNLSLIMFDIDHFKKINDSFGHPTGDSALCFLSDLARDFFRSSDLLFRVGGEEFTVLLPNTTSFDSFEVAEEFRLVVAKSSHIHNKTEINFTISLGVASLTPNIDNIDDFLKNLDVALYKAKEDGRNKTVLSLI